MPNFRENEIKNSSKPFMLVGITNIYVKDNI